MLVRVLAKGQIVIHKEIRKKPGLMPGDIVEIKNVGEEIIIHPVNRNYTEETRGIVKGKLSLEELEELYGIR